ncbi:MAG: universal stress protein [Betaproteobacteria bacterium]|nr:universal stress protein [Betaproteobacteria bacterium]
MIELARSHVPSGDVRLLLVHGYAIPELLQKGYDLAADLVVLTKRGDSLAGDCLLDSVTLQLLHRSWCDVLIVR